MSPKTTCGLETACSWPEVTIGTGAVVAARSIVTRDVAPYTVVAGAPAQVKKLRFPESLVEMLLVRLKVVKAVGRAKFLLEKWQLAYCRRRTIGRAPVRHGQVAIDHLNNLELIVPAAIVPADVVRPVTLPCGSRWMKRVAVTLVAPVSIAYGASSPG